MYGETHNVWKFICLILVLITCNFPARVKGSTILNPDSANLCQAVVSYISSRQTQTIVWTTHSYKTCIFFNFGGCFLWADTTKYRLVSRQATKYVSVTSYRTKPQCCNGWSQVGDECTKPVCTYPCIHGDCVAPNRCSCKAGYTGATCAEDINECQTNNGGCQQICRNYNGSYSCACNTGYQVSPNDPKICEDIDECADSDHNCFCVGSPCNATCANHVGNYTCECSAGFHTKDNRVCQDIDECNANNGGCSDMCINEAGNYHCDCSTGYELQNDKWTCKDIDECLDNNGGCDHTCTNNNGSYICSCKDGFVLESNKLTCSDHDECANINHGCQYCLNLHGSYKCVCPKGFDLNNDNKTCSDVNECSVLAVSESGKNTTKAGCTFGCINTFGSFVCTCPPGWVLLHDRKTCIDYDECLPSTVKLCSETCINTIGSYRCICKDGYTLAANQRDCVGEPCENIPALLNGTATCLSEVTDGQCFFQCNQGFTITGDSTRRCQTNHRWSGKPTFCERRSCSPLDPPLNTKLRLPCDARFKSTCQYECDRGFLSLRDKMKSTCNINNDTDDMFWSNQGIKCLAPSSCNDLGNSGLVKFKDLCKCHENGYIDIKCKQGLISVPNVIILEPGIEKTFEIKTSMPTSFQIDISTNDPINLVSTPTNVVLDQTVSFKLKALKPGYYFLEYKLSNGQESFFAQKPEISLVYAKRNGIRSLETPISFDGSLKEGCYEIPSSLGKPLKSNTKLNTDNSTNGIIQIVIGDKIMVPVSISGGYFLHGILKQKSMVKMLQSDSRTNDTCFGVRNDIVSYFGDVLATKSFILSIEKMLNQMTPFWFKIYINDQNSDSISTLYEEFTPTITKGDELVSGMKPEISVCTKQIPIKTDSFYVVYRTMEELRFLFPTKRIIIPSNILKCIVIDITKNYVFVPIIFMDTLAKDMINQELFKPFSIAGNVSLIGFQKNADKMVTYATKELKYGRNDLYMQANLKGLFEHSNTSKIYENKTTTKLQSYKTEASIKFGMYSLSQQLVFSVKGVFDVLSIEYVSSLGACSNGSVFNGTLKLHTKSSFNDLFGFYDNHDLNIHIQDDTVLSSINIDTNQLFTQLPDSITRVQQLILMVKSFELTETKLKALTELTGLLEQIVASMNTLRTNVKSVAIVKDLSSIRNQLIEAQRRFRMLYHQYLNLNEPSVQITKQNINSFNLKSGQINSVLMGYTMNFESNTKSIKYMRLAGAGFICITSNVCFEGGKLSLMTGESINKCNFGRNFDAPQDSSVVVYEFTKNTVLASSFHIEEGAQLRLIMSKTGTKNYFFHVSGKYNINGNMVLLSITISSDGKFTAQGNSSIFGQSTFVLIKGSLDRGKDGFYLSLNFPGSSQLIQDIKKKLVSTSKQYQASLYESEKLIKKEILDGEKYVQYLEQKSVFEKQTLEQVKRRFDNVSTMIIDTQVEVVNAKREIEEALANDTSDIMQSCINGPMHCPSHCLSRIEAIKCNLGIDYSRIFIEQICENRTQKFHRVIVDHYNSKKIEYVDLLQKLECFNECPPLISQSQSLSNVSRHINDLGNCYRRCSLSYVPVRNSTTVQEEVFRVTNYNETIEECTNILKQSPGLFENVVCLRPMLCVMSPHPFCQTRVESCNTRFMRMRNNTNFTTVFEKYRLNVNKLDVLQNIKESLDSRKTFQETRVSYLDEHEVNDKKTNILNIRKQLEKFQEAKTSQSSVISDYLVNLDFDINNVSITTLHKKGTLFPFYIPAIIHTRRKQVSQILVRLNINDRTESVYNAAEGLFRHIVHETRNSTNSIKSDISSNEIYRKCYEVESSIDFVTSVLIMIQRKIKDFQEKEVFFANDAAGIRSNNNQLFQELQQRNKENENSELLAELKQNLQQIVPSSPKWNDTYSRFLTTLEGTMKNDTTCFTLYNCVYFHFRRILANLENVNVHNINTTRKRYQELNQTFTQILQSSLTSSSETKEMVRSAYQIMQVNDAVSIFCGRKPQLKKPVSGTITVKEGDNLVISVEIVNTQYDYTMSWMINQKFILGATQLQFRKVAAVGDNGLYTCQVINKFGRSDCGTIKVIVIPRPKFFNPSNTIIVYAKSPRIQHFLICNATDSSGLIQWFYNPFSDKMRKIRVSGGEKWLSMSPRLARSSGYYWCEVRNSDFIESSSKTMFLQRAVFLPTEQVTVTIALKLSSLIRKRKDTELQQRSVSERNRRSVPESLTTTAADNLLVAIVSAMGVDEKHISNLTYNKLKDREATIRFIIATAHLNQMLEKVETWDKLTNTIIENRKSLLTKLSKLEERIRQGMMMTINDGKGTSLTFVANNLKVSESTLICSSGYGLLENGFVCGECSPGTKSSKNKCVACARNEYQPRSGQQTCLSCPANSITYEVGSMFIKDCKLQSILTTTTTASTTLTTMTTSTTTEKATASPGGSAGDDDIIVPSAAAGGGVLLLIIIIVILCFIYRRKNQTKKSISNEPASYYNPTFSTDRDVTFFNQRLPFEDQTDGDDDVKYSIPEGSKKLTEKDFLKSSSQKRFANDNLYHVDPTNVHNEAESRPKRYDNGVIKPDEKSRPKSPHYESIPGGKKQPPALPPRSDINPYHTIPLEKETVDLGKNEDVFRPQAKENPYDIVFDKPRQRPPPLPSRSKTRGKSIKQDRSSVSRSSANQFEDIPNSFPNLTYGMDNSTKDEKESEDKESENPFYNVI